MAPIGRAGLLQLLRGTRKPRQPRGVPTTLAGTVVAPIASPEPTASVLVDPHARAGGSLASATACAPSLSRGSLCRQSSEIRTGCANERPSGSVRGVSREWYPYRDLHHRVNERNRLISSVDFLTATIRHQLAKVVVPSGTNL